MERLKQVIKIPKSQNDVEPGSKLFLQIPSPYLSTKPGQVEAALLNLFFNLEVSHSQSFKNRQTLISEIRRLFQKLV